MLPHLPVVAAVVVVFSTCLAAEAAALVILTFEAVWTVVCNTVRNINSRDFKLNKELHSSNINESLCFVEIRKVH